MCVVWLDVAKWERGMARIRASLARERRPRPRLPDETAVAIEQALADAFPAHLRSFAPWVSLGNPMVEECERAIEELKALGYHQA
jgi:hypothetical protein